jgi:hypothetical protein
MDTACSVWAMNLFLNTIPTNSVCGILWCYNWHWTNFSPSTRLFLTFCWPCIIMYHNNLTNLLHFHFHNHYIVYWSSTCFGRQASIFSRHYTSSFWCELRALVPFGPPPSQTTDRRTIQRRIQPEVPAGLRPTGQATLYQATGPTPTTPSPISQSSQNLQPAKSYICTQLTPKNC